MGIASGWMVSRTACWCLTTRVTVWIVWRFRRKTWSSGSVSYTVHNARKGAVPPAVMYWRHMGLQSSSCSGVDLPVCVLKLFVLLLELEDYVGSVQVFVSLAAVMIDVGVLVAVCSAVFCILSSFCKRFWLTVVIALLLYSMVFVCSILYAMLRVSFVVLQLVVMSLFRSSKCDMKIHVYQCRWYHIPTVFTDVTTEGIYDWLFILRSGQLKHRVKFKSQQLRW